MRIGCAEPPAGSGSGPIETGHRACVAARLRVGNQGRRAWVAAGLLPLCLQLVPLATQPSLARSDRCGWSVCQSSVLSVNHVPNKTDCNVEKRCTCVECSPSPSNCATLGKDMFGEKSSSRVILVIRQHHNRSNFANMSIYRRCLGDLGPTRTGENIEIYRRYLGKSSRHLPLIYDENCNIRHRY